VEVLLCTESSVGFGVVPETGDWPLVGVGGSPLHKVSDGFGFGLLGHAWVIVHPVQVIVGADPRTRSLSGLYDPC